MSTSPDEWMAPTPRDRPLGPPAAPVSPPTYQMPPPPYWPTADSVLPPPPPPKRRTGLYLALAGVAVVLAVLAGAVAYAVVSHRPVATATAASAATSPAAVAPATEAAPPPETPPAPGDFELTIKVTSKECFGSAGCNVGFRVQVAYTGDPKTKTYKVTYRVDGAEEPFVGSFDFDYTAGTVLIDDENMVSTKSSRAVLKATPVDVLEN